MLTQCNFGIHIGEFEEGSVKIASLDISVSAAVCTLQSLFSSFVLPYPAFKFRNHLLLLFENFYRFALIEYACLFGRIGNVENSKGTHIECVFEQIKHIHSLCSPNGVVELLVFAVLVVLSKSGFVRNRPKPRNIIVTYTIFFGQKGLCRLWILTILVIKADEMQNKIINYIGRHPRRAKRNINIFGRNVTLNNIL